MPKKSGFCFARSLAPLTGLGMTEFKASRYESKITKGQIQIAVHAANPVNLIPAKTMSRESGASRTGDPGPACHQEGSKNEYLSEPSETDWFAVEAACSGILL